MPSSPAPRALPFRTRLTATLRRWFDTAHVARDDVAGEGIDWLRALPFLGMHLACLAVFAVAALPDWASAFYPRWCPPACAPAPAYPPRFYFAPPCYPVYEIPLPPPSSTRREGRCARNMAGPTCRDSRPAGSRR